MTKRYKNGTEQSLDSMCYEPTTISPFLRKSDQRGFLFLQICCIGHRLFGRRFNLIGDFNDCNTAILDKYLHQNDDVQRRFSSWLLYEKDREEDTSYIDRCTKNYDLRVLRYINQVNCRCQWSKIFPTGQSGQSLDRISGYQWGESQMARAHQETGLGYLT